MAASSSASQAFVPLHVNTQYSVLEGATKLDQLIKTAQTHQWPAVAITDKGNLYGAVSHYTKAKAAGIQPILGTTIALIEGDITDKKTRRDTYDIVLLAQNMTGWRNLCQLLTTAHLEGFYYRPRINWDLLENHAEGLVCLTSGLHGPLAHAVLRAQPDVAFERAARLKTVFSAERLFIELQDHGRDAERLYTQSAIEIADRLSLRQVITNDSHFTAPEHTQAHDILQCLQQGKTMAEFMQRPNNYGPEFYLKSRGELFDQFGFLNDADRVNRALDATLDVAELCKLELPLGQTLLPDYPLPAGETAAGYLKQIAEQLARQKYDGASAALLKAVQDRLDFELGIINQMGFPTYFLIVWDFIDYARKNGIPVGPGRGSAAGSLVAFVLGITNIDPIEHNLLFERFLNPERVSMPDIDIDFCIDRREEVIQYVREKYGSERVCQIATFGTLAARAALKAVARVREIPYADSDKWAKLIPATPGTKLNDALEKGQPLKALYDGDEQVREIVDLALGVEGLTFNVGVHAAGVVISKDPLSTIIPLQRAKEGGSKEGGIVSQMTMGDLEQLGLLKMDFLGLRNLTIIHNTLNLVQKSGTPPPNMDKLPLDDAAVYQMLTRADTDGVFQLESGGMKALVRDLKPNVFEDINALVALFRPGPLNSGMVKQFVDRKHGREQVRYDHPALEPILSATYGTIVYQEQIMQVAQHLAGYSLGQADLLRRAMGKKKAEVMAKERDGFLAGAIKNGVDETLANTLFDTMTEFAAYCFNRSHSAAYALVAYQTAYLKAHHPVAYLSALLSSVSSDLDKIQLYINVAKQLGIQVLPPDVTQSELDFSPSEGPPMHAMGSGEGTDPEEKAFNGADQPNTKAIRFGLGSIKNVGTGVVESILQARAEAPFANLEDFIKRVDPKVLNKKTLESLIACGALSAFEPNRKYLAQNIETMARYGEQLRQQQETGQASLFDLLGAAGAGDDASAGVHHLSGLVLSGNPDDDYRPEEIQKFEKSLLGIYLTSHPLDDVLDVLPMLTSHSILQLPDLKDGAQVVVGGLIIEAQRKISKNNKPLCVGKLEDLTSNIEFVAFSEALGQYDDMLMSGQKVRLAGTLQFRGDDADMVSIVVKRVMPLAPAATLALQFTQIPTYQQVAMVQKLFAESHGETGQTPMIVLLPDQTKIKPHARYWVSQDAIASLKQKLEAHLGNLVKVVA
ncbi:MAG: DNA polymerase III subunit alpha [Vampirovibrionales bacterium]|nr:DNA polymerase III subunit alpha [Vampirovibrionales bacterium]